MSGVNTGLQCGFRNYVLHQIYINCRNHRLALCVKHLIKEFPVLAELDELLIGIWKLFHYSPQRYHVLMEIQQTYGMTKLKFIRAAATRWLSHGRACSRLLDRYVPILDSFDAIFAVKRDPDITGLRNMLTDKKMVAVATVLCDILKPVVLFSDYLQGDVHFSLVNLRLKELVDSLSHLVRRFQACAGGQRDTDLYLDRLTDLWEEIDDRTQYACRLRALGAALTLNQVVVEIAVPMIHGLINELTDAFHCSPVLDGFRVFDLRQIPNDVAELGQYGEEEIHNLAAHYGRALVDTFKGHMTQAQPTFTEDVYIQQFAGFKHQMFLISQRASPEDLQNPQLLLSKLSEDPIIQRAYPAMYLLVVYASLIPSSTAGVERLFSLMNTICTPTRSSLKQSSLESIVRCISVGGPSLSPAQLVKAMQHFKNT